MKNVLMMMVMFFSFSITLAKNSYAQSMNEIENLGEELLTVQKQIDKSDKKNYELSIALARLEEIKTIVHKHYSPEDLTNDQNYLFTQLMPKIYKIEKTDNIYLKEKLAKKIYAIISNIVEEVETVSSANKLARISGFYTLSETLSTCYKSEKKLVNAAALPLNIVAGADTLLILPYITLLLAKTKNTERKLGKNINELEKLM